MQPFGIEEGPLVAKAQQRKYLLYKASVLILTAFSYAAFHAARKVTPVVKSVLKGTDNRNNSTTTGWAPFDGTDGQTRLGELDMAFLGTYAVCLFFSGHLGDQWNLRYLLAAGMLGSGTFTILLGMAYFLNVHTLAYFIIMSMFAGIFQSTGWPSVVAVVANWSEQGKRGLVMGLWSTNLPLGNIFGTVVASSLLSQGWGWSYVVPGLLLLVLGLLVSVFLVVQPADVGLAAQQMAYTHLHTDDAPDGLPEAPLDARDPVRPPTCPKDHHHGGLRFWDALSIPGVPAFALCLFFSKLIGYTFMTWLPYYINSAPIGDSTLTPKDSGHLSILFDVGGVAGGILAGNLSDRTGSSALVATSLLLLTVPILWLYQTYGHVSLAINATIMVLAGVVVNGPHGLITTAVSADLGNHDSLKGDVKIQATVIAIIDGVGSVGAAVGPMITGLILQHGNFSGVFLMLELSAIAAVLMLLKLVVVDVRRLLLNQNNGKHAHNLP